MTNDQTDPFTVTRTDAGIVIASAAFDDDPWRDANRHRFALTLPTRHQADRFLKHLYNPTGDLTADDWLGVLTIDDKPPVEPRVTTIQRLAWFEDCSVPEARLTIRLWPDYTHPHVYLDLDLPALGRLYDNINRLVDSALPARAADPDRIHDGLQDMHQFHRTEVWAMCTDDCPADRTSVAEPPF